MPKHILPFAGFAARKTFAAWPVWKDSTTSEVKYYRIPKKQAWDAYRRLKAWSARQEVETRTVTKTVMRDGRTVTVTQQRPVKYGGGIGSACLRVYECLVFDFLNFRSGRLDPSYENIAKKTGLGRSTVAEALKRLKALRIIHWQRRAVPIEHVNGSFRLKQDTNAYGILSPSSWLGYEEPPAPPAPHPTAWGAAPVVLDPIEEAKASGDNGAWLRAMVEYGDRDQRAFAETLLRLGEAIDAKARRVS